VYLTPDEINHDAFGQESTAMNFKAIKRRIEKLAAASEGPAA